MSEEWMKAAVWGLVTLALLIVLWSSWRAYRADQTRLKKLQDFRERYDVEMTQLYRWFASDECALMVLDWLDLQLAGGDLRPDGSRRLEVAIHGLQAVRQAVRDSHFNDRCRGAADARCAMSVAASNRPRVTPEQMADLRNACPGGVDLDVFMALCLNQLLEGRTVKVISERREYLNPRPELAPFDRISEPVVRRIVNDLGEQVWPCAEDAFTVEALAKLRTVFGKGDDASMTAGNSTALTDGAAVVLLAEEDYARGRGWPVLARVVDAQVAAADYTTGAEDLLLAPARAIPALLERNNLTLADFDYYEFHEAFASTVLATLKALEKDGVGTVDRSKLNVNGSSLAAGHPFAATGGRIVASLAKMLAAKGPGSRGLISICAAGGQGVVAILEA